MGPGSPCVPIPRLGLICHKPWGGRQNTLGAGEARGDRLVFPFSEGSGRLDRRPRLVLMGRPGRCPCAVTECWALRGRPRGRGRGTQPVLLSWALTGEPGSSSVSGALSPCALGLRSLAAAPRGPRPGGRLGGGLPGTGSAPAVLGWQLQAISSRPRACGSGLPCGQHPAGISGPAQAGTVCPLCPGDPRPRALNVESVLPAKATRP